MSQLPIEIILLRQLASYLVMPMFIVDDHGALLFYNESAEVILGKRFEETGELTKEELERMFQPADEHGTLLPADEVPVIKAMLTREPTHQKMILTGADGVRRAVESTGIPIIGTSREVLGALAIFWEIPLRSTVETSLP